MWWRQKRREHRRQLGEGNREAMWNIVNSGEVPGILAYLDGIPVGWCSIAPRTRFPVMDRSPNLKRVDDTPVWSVACFFIAKDHRNRGLMRRLLDAAVEHARRQGAAVVEGYPVDAKGKRHKADYAWTGYLPIFTQAGFVEVARRSETRPILRRYLKPQAKGNPSSCLFPEG
jgi:GNAT superfamily N-acetyltransferase